MDEAAVNVLGVDNAAARSAQCDRLVAIKGKRDGTAVAAVLDEIRAAAKFEFSAGETTVPAEQNLLGLAVKASRLRATVGEISDAMRDVWGNHAPSNAVVQGAYSASYNASTQKNAKDAQHTRTPLHPAALASVPYGVVLIRVRVRTSTRRCSPRSTASPRARAAAHASSSPRWARTATTAARA